MVRKVITDIDSSKMVDPNWIMAIILKNCDSEYFICSSWYFQCFLKEPYSPHYGKVSCMVPEFKNVRKMSVAKNERPVSLYSVVSKPSENSKMIGLFISTRVIAFVLISRMVSGLLVLCWSFNRSLSELLGYLTVWDETNCSN